MTAVDLDRLRQRLARWNDPSWAHLTRAGRPRADAVFAAVQRLADIAAEAEGRDRLAVPRLAGGAVLADQLVVMAHDVGLTGDPAATAAADTLIAALAAELGC